MENKNYFGNQKDSSNSESDENKNYNKREENNFIMSPDKKDINPNHIFDIPRMDRTPIKDVNRIR